MAQEDGRTVFYNPVQLTRHFLSQARTQAEDAGEFTDTDPEGAVLDAIGSIVMSAFAIESGVNAMADSMIPDAKREDFDRVRGRFRDGRGRASEAAWKWRTLFKMKAWAGDLADAPLVDADEVMTVRNRFAHYKPLKDSVRILYDRDIVNPIGPGHRFISLTPPADEPHRIEWGVVERFANAHTAARFYMAARALFVRWAEINGDMRGAGPDFPELAIPEPPVLPNRLPVP